MLPAAVPVTAPSVSLRDRAVPDLTAVGEGSAGGGALPAAASGGGGAVAGAKVVPGQLVVTTTGHVPPDLAGAGLSGASWVASASFGAQTTWLLEVAPGDTARASGLLARLPAVAAVAPNHLIEPMGEAPPTNDPLLPSQWSHGSDVSNVYGAWAVWDALPAGRRSDSTVAVIDWFPEKVHDDLNLLTGYWSAPTLTAGQPVATLGERSQDSDHGIAVSGVIGALKNNSLGAAGVAPGVPVLPIRVTDSNGNATDFNIIQSLQICGYYNRADSPYTNLSNAGAGPVRVVNMSLGASIAGVVATYDAALEFLRDRGILVLVAAGNNQGDGRVESPANNPLVAAVSASMQYQGFELLAPYSSRGDEIWVAGPGNMIWATGRGNTYKLFNGTSSATPFVAGVAALVNAVYGTGDASQATKAWTARVKNRLAQTATDLGPVGFDTGWGHGRVHALRAVTGNLP
ncbi:MAG: S8 family serine peptidase [Candidatus Sericytochromatia bacterium]|nr:S8 family serine peptidase [Candidatus Tanganyikabacteria bacterium]